jgi:pterin-4a-carbinolamine dehydratase
VATAVAHDWHEATITITPSWVGVTLSTPAANGLTEKDFLRATALEFGA